MAYYPKAAMRPDGEFVVVWASLGQDGSDDGIFGRVFGATGGPIVPEFQVNTYTSLNQQHADVAYDEDGSFIVVWESFGQDGSEDGIFGQYFSSGGERVGGEFQINMYTTQNQFRPRVTSIDAGEFVVIWTSESQDGDDVGVYGRLVKRLVGPIGEEFQVNTYTIGPQGIRGATAVDRIGRGRAVVAWESGAAFEIGQDGSEQGVFAQRYCVESVSATCGDATCRRSVDPDGVDSDTITATDALLVLNGAIGLDACVPCRCDVNSTSGVTATDALLTLSKAVGAAVSLNCPPCS